MRTLTVLDKALFAKESQSPAEITLPHTWNAQDGQDGGNDYWRGKGIYEITLPTPTPGKRQYIQFEGANHTAEVFCNGQRLGEHKGGFSTFRFELTSVLKEAENTLMVIVDNDAPEVYPQAADFTFFGGLYRPVTFIEVDDAHIDLLKHGSQGVFVVAEAGGHTRVDVFSVSVEGCEIQVILQDNSGNTVAESKAPAVPQTTLDLDVTAPALWSGIADPVCYTAVVRLLKDGRVVDEVSQRYGYRSFSVDADKGFFLNGHSYPLHGVSRHQDREGMGWALTEKEHQKDMALIREIGANTIRLAHYQHSQYFYDLCDETGMVVWAEIPFISLFIEGAAARENTVTQLTELILQNYNHPSICFWGIGNELTMGGDSDELYENLLALNELSKKLDPTRLTVMAQLNNLSADHRHTTITDLQGYNIYIGWYTGKVEENGAFLDGWHEKNPSRPLAVSEYGAEGFLNWHSIQPKNHDYTEEYHALYHETLLSTFASRPYLWGTWAWNMFDFAADARNEGGCKGRNNKGLVTYDRGTKKNAFYIYKATWSDEPMVHICGRRFADRAPEERDVKVYSNAGNVTLIVNCAVVETLPVEGHCCVFRNVPLNPGSNRIEAVSADGASDVITLNGVEKTNPDYIMPADEVVTSNWFGEMASKTVQYDQPDGYFSVKDTMGELLKSPQGAAVIMELKAMLSAKAPGGAASSRQSASGNMMNAVMDYPLHQLLKMIQLPREMILSINKKLNQIKKPD